MTDYYSKNQGIILRKESFGGLVFNKKKAITLELDKEGFYLLSLLDRPITLRELKKQLSKKFCKTFSKSKIKSVLKQFHQKGFVNKSAEIPFANQPKKPSEKFSLGYLKRDCGLSAPETVHFSITGKCNLNCPFCYGKSETKDLSTKQIFKLIEELSSIKVFQLAVGGGEPFLRKDIFKIINYCWQKGLVVNITSNGTLITQKIIRKIKDKIGQINLSYNQLTNKNLKKLLNLLFKNNIKVGINLLVTKSLLFQLEKIIRELLDYRFSKIIILRPKPNPNKEWYEKNRLTKKDLLKLKKILDKYEKRINVDCSLTCLMCDIPKRELNEKAVYGCVAGARFCTIKNNGDVYPCSFFATKEFLAGNILTSNFKNIWLRAESFKRFRKMDIKIKGNCGSCEIKDYCKGCRRIALESKDFYSEEKECPKIKRV